MSLTPHSCAKVCKRTVTTEPHVHIDYPCGVWSDNLPVVAIVDAAKFGSQETLTDLLEADETSSASIAKAKCTSALEVFAGGIAIQYQKLIVSEHQCRLMLNNTDLNANQVYKSFERVAVSHGFAWHIAVASEMQKAQACGVSQDVLAVGEIVEREPDRDILA